MSADGSWLTFSAPDPGVLRAVADRCRRRKRSSGSRMAPTTSPVGTGSRARRIGGRLRARLPPLARRPNPLTSSGWTATAATTADRVQPRRPRRYRAAPGAGAARQGGRPDIQGWFIPAATTRRRAHRSSSRSTAARTRCTAGRRSWEFQVPGRRRHRGLLRRIHAAPRATARRSTTPTTATWGPARRATCSAGVESLVADGAGGPGPTGRDRWVVPAATSPNWIIGLRPVASGRR